VVALDALATKRTSRHHGDSPLRAWRRDPHPVPGEVASVGCGANLRIEIHRRSVPSFHGARKRATRRTPKGSSGMTLNAKPWLTLLLLALVMWLLLFVPAGAVHYWQGWMHVFVFFPRGVTHHRKLPQ